MPFNVAEYIPNGAIDDMFHISHSSLASKVRADVIKGNSRVIVKLGFVRIIIGKSKGGDLRARCVSGGLKEG